MFYYLDRGDYAPSLELEQNRYQNNSIKSQIPYITRNQTHDFRQSALITLLTENEMAPRAKLLSFTKQHTVCAAAC